MRGRRFFLAPEFGMRDFNWYFLRQLVATLILAHIDFWVPKYALRYLYFYMLQTNFTVADSLGPVVLFAPFVFMGFTTCQRLVRMHFQSGHARRSIFGLLLVFFGEVILLGCIRLGFWAGAYYALLIIIAGFLIFLRWFSEGPEEYLKRLLREME